MIRILQFEGGNPRHVHYRNLLENVLQARGSKANDPQAKVSNSERRSEARLIAHLDSISVLDEDRLALINAARAKENLPPLEPPDDPLAPDGRPRMLSPDGGTLRIQQEDFTLLETYAKETQWQSQFTRLGVALEDWLTAAEKVEVEAQPEPLKAVGGRRGNRATG